MSTPMNDAPAGNGTWLERVIFGNRVSVLFVFVALTIFFGYHASQIKPDASFARLIPLQHEFIQNMLANKDDLENLGNFVRIAVATKDGDIFSREYMATLAEINDEVFYLKGVDRAGLKSLWTPNVRWVEVTEEGFQGGPVIPDGYNGSPDSLDQLRENILKSGEVGRLVADDFKSTIVYAPLAEVGGGANGSINYQQFSQQLEAKIREKYETKNPNIEIHIVGFAKKVGDLIEGIQAIFYFAVITIGLTAVLLLLYTRCIIATLVPIITTLLAVVWQLGILRLLGYGLDPYSVLVPFLVFAIGVSHALQVDNQFAMQRVLGHDKLMSARLTYRYLLKPGVLALCSDAMGFLTLLMIEIDVIRDLAVSSGVGVAIIIITTLTLHPILISYMGLSNSGMRQAQKAETTGARKWRVLSFLAHPHVAPVSVMIAVLGCVVALYYQKDLKIGDLDRGAPEFHPDSRYNQDNDYIINNYSTSADVMVIMVKSAPEKCASYPVMNAMDRIQWRLQNLEGVQSSESLLSVSKLVTKALNEGSLKWFELSRSESIINSTVSRAPSGLINSDCSMTPIIVYLNDHQAETLSRVVKAMQEIMLEYQDEDFKFLLAAGNAGIEAATNEVIAEAKNQMLIVVYLTVGLLCFATFRSWRATVCIITPLALTSLICEALMAQLGIGMKVATLPVIAVGVGIGVDYGIYIYSDLEKRLRQGLPLQEAYFNTLMHTGKAVIFTGVTLGVGVITWIFSPIKFQADMGILLFFMFVWNMIGAVWLLPAMARFLLRPDKMAGPQKAALKPGPAALP